jgi:osmotically-inducible protein OsmY
MLMGKEQRPVWGWAQVRSEITAGRAALATVVGTEDLEYAAVAARITPVLTDLAPHASSLCTTVTAQGAVVLDGRISDRALAAGAVAQIVATPGVRRVYNHLYTDAQIADLITAALALDERTTWEAIDVVYEGGTAALLGIVTSVEARVAAEEIAQHTPLVWHVENRLVVEQPTEKEVSYANGIYGQPSQPTAASSAAALPARQDRPRADSPAGGGPPSGGWQSIAASSAGRAAE